MNKNFLILILSLIISISFGEAQEISKEEFLSIKTTSEQVLKICPPEKCVIVGVGRSPTPVMAYLDDESKDNIWPLPLSAFRYGQYGDYLDDGQKKKLFEHFDKFLPTISQLHGRSVLLLDFSCTGASLVSAHYYIKEYYGSKNKQSDENDGKQETTVDMVALACASSFSADSMDTRIDNVIVLPSSSLSTNLFGQRYDEHSAYGAFKISDSPISKNLQGSYKDLRKKFMEMKKQYVEPQVYALEYHQFDPHLQYDESLPVLKKRRILNNLYRYPVKDIEKNVTLILKDPSQEIRASFANAILRYSDPEEFMPSYLKFFEQDQPTSESALQAILFSSRAEKIKKFREDVLEKILTHPNEKNRDLALNTTLRLFAGNEMESKKAMKLLQMALKETDEKFPAKVIDDLNKCYDYWSQIPCEGPTILEKFSEDEQNSIYQTALNSKSPLAQAKAKVFLDPNLQYDQNLPLFKKHRILNNLDCDLKEDFEKNLVLILKDPSQEIRKSLAKTILRCKNLEGFMPFYLKFFEEDQTEDQTTSVLAIHAILESKDTEMVIKFREEVLEKILTHKDEKNRALALNATWRLFAGNYMGNKQALKLIQTALTGPDARFSEKVMDELKNCYNYKLEGPCIGPAIFERFSVEEKDSIYQAGLSSKSALVKFRARVHFLKKTPIFGLSSPCSSY